VQLFPIKVTRANLAIFIPTIHRSDEPNMTNHVVDYHNVGLVHLDIDSAALLKGFTSVVYRNLGIAEEHKIGGISIHLNVM
jgi:hypothetical protein